MSDFDPYIVVAALSAAVIISYIFSLVSIKTRIPTVLMLLLLGIGVRQVVDAVGPGFELPIPMLQFLGVLGLIAILLEAGLDLSMSRDKLPLMRRATASAFFILILTAGAIAVVIRVAFEATWLQSIVYAIPLGVISSTIVASSIHYLAKDKREYLTYESSLSDIFGILIFNILAAGHLTVSLIVFDVVSIAIALVVSLVISVGLVFLLARINVPIKAFLIFAVLLFIYAVGHAWQLPTLLAVLIFGLILNNWRHSKLQPLHKYITAKDVENATMTVRSVTIETAFLIRTIFFIAFGYMINVTELLSLRVILIGTIMVACILITRFVYMLIFNRSHMLPEFFFSPRGLVTIVLFYSIPASLEIPGFSEGVLFYVVMLTTLILMIGTIWFTPKSARNETKPKIVADKEHDDETTESIDSTAR